MNSSPPSATHPSADPAGATRSARTAEFHARLERYPQLRTLVEGMLDEMENRAGNCNTADQAEEALVERLRQIGRQALTQWAEQRHAAVQPARDSGLRQSGKKKSVGGARSTELS